MTHTDPPGPAHVGWLRLPGGPWRKVCAAPTERQCWLLLLAAEAPPGHRQVERLVNDGRHPEHRKRPR